jgi:uncharacterized protein
MNLRAILFSRIAQFDEKYPLCVLAICTLAAALSVMYARSHLQIWTDKDALIVPAGRDNVNYLNYEKEFPDRASLTIVVDGQHDPAKAERFVSEAAARLLRDRVHVKGIFYRLDVSTGGANALWYMDPATLSQLAARIRDNSRFISAYSADPTLVTFFRLINEEVLRKMIAQAGPSLFGVPAIDTTLANSKANSALPVVDAALEGIASQANPSHAPMPWDAVLNPDVESGFLRDGYLSTENGKYLLMRVTPGGGGENDYRAMDAIESSLDRIRAKFPTIEAGITGGLALDRTLARSTARDITVASVIAIVSNVLLIVIPFGGIVEPAFCLAALLCGAAWSFGFVTLAIGHLNILSAAFTSILAGIGVNFPIHLMARYDEARLNGLPYGRAIRLSAVNTGNGVFAATAVMALAFVMPALTSFKAIAELGLISAAGLLLCFLSAILVFPSMVTLCEGFRPTANSPPRSAARITGLEKLFQRPGRIAAIGAVSAIAALALARRVTFDQNLLNLQPQNSEAVRLEYKLLEEGDHSILYAVAIAGNRADADRMAAEFGTLPQVAKVETLSTYLPAAQPEKLQALDQIEHIIKPITLSPLVEPSDPRALMRELELLKVRVDQWRLRRPSTEVERIDSLLAHALRLLYVRPYGFAGYERAMAADFDTQLEQLKAIPEPAAISNTKLPDIVRESFVGRSGKFLVRIYPREDIWRDAPLARFVAAIKQADPDVTGTPVQSYAITSAMRRGYEHAAILAMAAVLAFVLADLRSLGETLLAMLPLALGGAWLLGAMGLMGWDFNLANLFAVPIIIATGVDNGVNMVYRWREERRNPGLILRTAIGKSVTISSLTTIAGFAALIPASSHGISSLGLILSLGVSFILAATLVVMPMTFQLLRGYFQPARGNVLSVSDDAFGTPYAAEGRVASSDDR